MFVFYDWPFPHMCTLQRMKPIFLLIIGSVFCRLLWEYRFHFYRAMLCIRGTSHGPVSVCPSVTSQSSTKTAKRRITQTTPHDSPGTLVLMPKISAKFHRGHPLRGRQMQVGWVKIGYFRQITGLRKFRHNESLVYR